MNITKPEDLTTGFSKLEKIINELELKLKKMAKNKEFYKVIIPTTYDSKVLRKVEFLYIKAGWDNVKCLDYRGGTILMLSCWQFRQCNI